MSFRNPRVTAVEEDTLPWCLEKLLEIQRCWLHFQHMSDHREFLNAWDFWTNQGILRVKPIVPSHASQHTQTICTKSKNTFPETTSLPRTNWAGRKMDTSTLISPSKFPYPLVLTFWHIIALQSFARNFCQMFHCAESFRGCSLGPCAAPVQVYGETLIVLIVKDCVWSCVCVGGGGVRREGCPLSKSRFSEPCYAPAVLSGALNKISQPDCSFLRLTSNTSSLCREILGSVR